MLSDHWDDENRASNGVYHQPPLKAMTEVASAQPLVFDGQRLPAPFQDYYALSADYPVAPRAGASPILRRGGSPHSTRVESDPFASMLKTPSPTQAGSPEPPYYRSVYGSTLPRAPSPAAASTSTYSPSTQPGATLNGYPTSPVRPQRRDEDATLVSLPSLPRLPQIVSSILSFQFANRL